MTATPGPPPGGGPGPVAVVTGAARGIGAATVDLLVADGWRVVATDVGSDDPVLGYRLGSAEELGQVAERHRGQAVALVADVRSRADMDAAVSEALRRFGRLDAAVAVAGVMVGGAPLWETDDAAWDLSFDVNVGGVRRLAQAAVPALLAADLPRAGRFVAVSSAAGTVGLRRLAAYTASKHAVVGLVKGLAADLAGTGITANAVLPGSTRTVMLEETARIYDLGSPEEFGAQALVERLLEPHEPAALIAWLCSPRSSAVTGAALAADGGLTTS